MKKKERKKVSTSQTNHASVNDNNIKTKTVGDKCCGASLSIYFYLCFYLFFS